ncbi:MAG: hypothetical protein ABFE08_16280 [Armatimonadia bacterium]
MTGTVLDLNDFGSFWLLTIAAERRIVEQPIEPRHMRHLVEGEGLESPYDLEGREVQVSDDGMAIRLM